MVSKISDAFCIFRQAALACVFAKLTLISAIAVVQAREAPDTPGPGSSLEKPMKMLGQLPLAHKTPVLEVDTPGQSTPKEVVKVLFDPNTN